MELDFKLMYLKEVSFFSLLVAQDVVGIIMLKD